MSITVIPKFDVPNTPFYVLRFIDLVHNGSLNDADHLYKHALITLNDYRAYCLFREWSAPLFSSEKQDRLYNKSKVVYEGRFKRAEQILLKYITKHYWMFFEQDFSNGFRPVTEMSLDEFVNQTQVRFHGYGTVFVFNKDKTSPKFCELDCFCFKMTCDYTDYQVQCEAYRKLTEKYNVTL